MCVCVFWTFPNDVGSSIVLNNSVILVQYIIKIIIHKSIKKKKQIKNNWKRSGYMTGILDFPNGQMVWKTFNSVLEPNGFYILSVVMMTTIKTEAQVIV